MSVPLGAVAPIRNSAAGTGTALSPEIPDNSINQKILPEGRGFRQVEKGMDCKPFQVSDSSTLTIVRLSFYYYGHVYEFFYSGIIFILKTAMKIVLVAFLLQV